MKFSITAPLLLATLSSRRVNSMAVATASKSSTISTKATGGAGAHVPIGKDGEGEYTAKTKGW